MQAILCSEGFEYRSFRNNLLLLLAAAFAALDSGEEFSKAAAAALLAMRARVRGSRLSA